MSEVACLFCRIVNREIPAQIVHEDASSVAFRDINPQAPVHLLVVPRKHFATAAESEPSDEALIGHLHRVAAELARKNRLESYRVVVNNGAGAGQSVFHMHLHVLGGRAFAWPPG